MNENHGSAGPANEIVYFVVSHLQKMCCVSLEILGFVRVVGRRLIEVRGKNTPNITPIPKTMRRMRFI